MSIVDIIEHIRNIGPEDFTKDEARKAIGDLCKVIDVVEEALSEIGVYHQLDVYLGEYGNGRSLALEDCEINWQEYCAGDWISSSSTC